MYRALVGPSDFVLIMMFTIKDASKWWSMLNDPPIWQDLILYLLALLCSLIAIVAMMQLIRIQQTIQDYDINERLHQSLKVYFTTCTIQIEATTTRLSPSNCNLPRGDTYTRLYWVDTEKRLRGLSHYALKLACCLQKDPGQIRASDISDRENQMAELDARKAQKLSSTAKTLQRQIKTYNICDDCKRSLPNLELNFWDFSRKSTIDDCFLGLTLAVNPSVTNIEMVHKTRSTKQDVFSCFEEVCYNLPVVLQKKACITYQHELLQNFSINMFCKVHSIKDDSKGMLSSWVGKDCCLWERIHYVRDEDDEQWALRGWWPPGGSRVTLISFSSSAFLFSGSINDANKQIVSVVAKDKTVGQIEDEESSKIAGEQFGYPLIVKCRRLAYDGRGINVVAKSEEVLTSAMNALGGFGRGLYVEQSAPFVKELAVIVARGRDNSISCYHVVETVHRQERS
ncbi:unnamed protein product [Lactuca saligna]|uniref:ATP-grasp domain-containing protein n=1 Tax=Lactuca saligna TaxID=75948 RepID=A0AA35YAC7_LACSI|nr:unnamed protein product [Lactuca saligna]